MPIPTLDGNGLLPAGIHDCSLEEVRARFGRFQGSDTRSRLFARLEELHAAMARSELFAALIVDGSYVTANPSPNDIDVLLSLRPGHDYTRDLNMSDYALVSRPLVRKQFGFDVLVATEGSPAYEEYVQFFARVRGLPDLRKGLLRIAL